MLVDHLAHLRDGHMIDLGGPPYRNTLPGEATADA
jgi:hypothetical protein